jgi:Gluconate 2-dehydrogenase subunit 3
MTNISRRDAIRRMAIMVGGTIAIPDILKAWESPNIINVAYKFNARQSIIIGEIAEAIIPTTDSPGAIAAGVTAFIEKMITDCYTAEVREKFLAEVDRLGDMNYLDMNVEKRTQILKELEAAAIVERQMMAKAKSSWTDTSTLPDAKPFFDLMKELTVTGYFTSEIGCTQALRYEQVPGKYDGDVPYKKGDKAWATN